MENEAYIVAANGGSDYYYLFSILEYDDIPILFVAKNDSNQLFLCDCVEMRHVQRWVIAKTDYSILKALVEKKIKIFEALKQISNRVTVAEYEYERDAFSQKLNRDIEELDDSFLPDKNAYLLYSCADCETQIRLRSLADSNTIKVIWSGELFSVADSNIKNAVWTNLLNDESNKSGKGDCTAKTLITTNDNPFNPFTQSKEQSIETENISWEAISHERTVPLPYLEANQEFSIQRLMPLVA